MNARTRDVLKAAAARAHADAEPDDRKAVARHGKSRRTWARARAEGPVEVRAAQAYLWESPHPWRIAAELTATAKHRTVERLSRAELIERYRDLLEADAIGEGEDNALRVRRSVDWMDRAAASERDAAIDMEKAACERRFAVLGVTEPEVFG